MKIARHRLLSALLLFPLLLGACSDSTAPASAEEGSYKLQSLNEEALPVHLYSETLSGITYDTRMESGTLVLRRSHYEMAVVFAIRVNGQTVATQTVGTSGEYEKGSAGSLVFHDVDAEGPVVGKYANGQVTLEASDPEVGTAKFVFRK